jgi:hypothetical protein
MELRDVELDYGQLSREFGFAEEDLRNGGVNLTPSQRLQLVWPITCATYRAAGLGDPAQLRLRKDIVRVYRDGELIHDSHPEIERGRNDAH